MTMMKSLSIPSCFLLLLLLLLQRKQPFLVVRGFVSYPPPVIPYRRRPSSPVAVSSRRPSRLSSSDTSDIITDTGISNSVSGTADGIVAIATADDDDTTADGVVAVLQPSATSSSSATTSSSSTALPPAPPDTFTLWRRRLITHEDPFGIHKIASVAYSGSAAIILGTGAVRFFVFGSEVFAEIPPSLEVPALTFVVSNIVMCLASVRMAFLHRKFDLTARNAFLGTAVSSLFSGFFFLWTSPFAPDVLNTSPLINQGCFGILVILNVFFIADTLLKVPEVVESRRDRKAEAREAAAAEEGVGEYYDANRFFADAVGYVLPIAWGMPVVVSTGYVASVLHDRPWFVDQCLYIDEVTGQPGLNASICYLQVAASLAASYGSLFVTLRDKKLITKRQELVGITAFSVPALIWTIYVSVVYFMHLFDVH